MLHFAGPGYLRSCRGGKLCVWGRSRLAVLHRRITMSAPCPTFGFHVVIEPAAALASPARAELEDAWVVLLESRGLYCRGGGSVRLAYVVASEASQATENDRAAVRSWLAGRPEVARWTVGDLTDLDRAI